MTYSLELFYLITTPFVNKKLELCDWVLFSSSTQYMHTQLPSFMQQGDTIIMLLLTAAAQRFNAPILDHVAQQDDYPTLKNICEGRSLPAYEAAAEFTDRAAEELDGLLSELGGDKGTQKIQSFR